MHWYEFIIAKLLQITTGTRLSDMVSHLDSIKKGSQASYIFADSILLDELMHFYAESCFQFFNETFDARIWKEVDIQNICHNRKQVHCA